MTALDHLSNKSAQPEQEGGSAGNTGYQAVADLTEIALPVAREMKLVEEWLRLNLIDESPFVGELLSRLFAAGGKRVRPLITLLASQASLALPEEDVAHSKLSSVHIVLSVLTELIHSASLVHDDVIDAASTRRGKETVNRRFSDKMAVLLGDLLFAQASICLARIMNPVVVGVYGQVLGDLCSGEISQMSQQFSLKVDFDAYIKKSIGKTASLISAGAHCGAILNARPNDEIQGLKDYGENLGICFQIVDDLLDLTGTEAKTGKPVGSDLRSGLITAPALFTLQKEDALASELKALVKDRKVESDEGLNRAVEIIQLSGGIEKTVELARSYGDKARSSLSLLRPSAAKTSLENLIDYVLVRNS